MARFEFYCCSIVKLKAWLQENNFDLVGATQTDFFDSDHTIWTIAKFKLRRHTIQILKSEDDHKTFFKVIVEFISDTDEDVDVVKNFLDFKRSIFYLLIARPQHSTAS